MLRIITLSVLLSLGTVCAAAGDRDHDRARSAVSSGDVLPLGRILSAVRQQIPGRVLDAKLEGNKRRGQWRYRLKVLTPEGRMVRVTVDATNGRILRSR